MRWWIYSYLEYRSQYVSIGSAKSNMRMMMSGVPQGSVLGPVFYSLYTNELPETCKDRECMEICHLEKSDLFGRNCKSCGLVPCYADDLTVIVASKNPEDNKVKLVDKLSKISDFLENNSHCVNREKTKVQNYMVRQKCAKVTCDPVVMTIRSEDDVQKDIINLDHARILGLYLQRDYSWRAHLEVGAKPLIQALRRRLGAL